MKIIYNLKQQQNPQCAFSLQDGLKKVRRLQWLLIIRKQQPWS